MQLRAAQTYARDNVDGIGNRYGRALTSGLTVEDVQAWPEILQAVTGMRSSPQPAKFCNPRRRSPAG